jgi:hypothetical protein
MSKMGSHDMFGHLQHKLWQKEKLGIDPTSMRADGVQYTIRKLSMRATTLH